MQTFLTRYHIIFSLKLVKIPKAYFILQDIQEIKSKPLTEVIKYKQLLSPQTEVDITKSVATNNCNLYYFII